MSHTSEAATTGKRVDARLNRYRVPLRFYAAPTVQVARALLGTFLVHETSRGRIVGRIVETEAYLSDGTDSYCHAHKGPTKRNLPMFGPAGTAYVYLIYGMHLCFNVVTQPEGVGEAVLVRALEPVEGIEEMERLRRTNKRTALCSGPGKLAAALAITSDLNGSSLREGPLSILNYRAYGSRFGAPTEEQIVTTTRIGISKGSELPLRFYLRGSEFISKP